MTISAFSMCCGYYDGVINGEVSIDKLFSKRYEKIWPFFALVVVLDFALSPSLKQLYETFANLTLAFGLLPNANITVIGVGWFLGVVFVFYMLFPFICFLLSRKTRAWLVMVVTMLYSVTCSLYFLDTSHVVANYFPRHSFLFCSMFFMAGGLIYLYRSELMEQRKKKKCLIVIAMLACIVLYCKVYFFRTAVIMPFSMLLLFSLMLIYAIGNKGAILNNRFVKAFSSISMEVYLCHMIIFRVVDKLHLTYLIGTSWYSYIVIVVLVLMGAVVFSILFKKLLKALGNGNIKQNA